MEETLTSEEDQSPAVAEEKGEGVYRLTPVLCNYVFHLVV